MANTKTVEDKVEIITEDEFLFQMRNELKNIDKQKKVYVDTLNKIVTYQSFGFAVNYYYNHTQKKYECEFIKKGKIGFEQNRPYEPSKNMIKKVNKK